MENISIKKIKSKYEDTCKSSDFIKAGFNGSVGPDSVKDQQPQEEQINKLKEEQILPSESNTLDGSFNIKDINNCILRIHNSNAPDEARDNKKKVQNKADINLKGENKSMHKNNAYNKSNSSGYGEKQERIEEINNTILKDSQGKGEQKIGPLLREDLEQRTVMDDECVHGDDVSMDTTKDILCNRVDAKIVQVKQCLKSSMENRKLNSEKVKNVSKRIYGESKNPVFGKLSVSVKDGVKLDFPEKKALGEKIYAIEKKVITLNCFGMENISIKKIKSKYEDTCKSSDFSKAMYPGFSDAADSVKDRQPQEQSHKQLNEEQILPSESNTLKGNINIKSTDTSTARVDTNVPDGTRDKKTEVQTEADINLKAKIYGESQERIEEDSTGVKDCNGKEEVIPGKMNDEGSIQIDHMKRKPDFQPEIMKCHTVKDIFDNREAAASCKKTEKVKSSNLKSKELCNKNIADRGSRENKNLSGKVSVKDSLKLHLPEKSTMREKARAARKKSSTPSKPKSNGNTAMSRTDDKFLLPEEEVVPKLKSTKQVFSVDSKVKSIKHRYEKHLSEKKTIRENRKEAHELNNDGTKGTLVVSP